MNKMNRTFRMALMSFTTAVSTALVLLVGMVLHGIVVDGQPLGDGIVESVLAMMSIAFFGALGAIGLGNNIYLAVTGREWD